MENPASIAANPQQEILRPLANFPTSSWDHDFILSLENSVPESYFRQIELSKEKVKEMLLDSTSDLVDKVSLIDELCQLGVSYHFENEINDQLKLIWGSQHDLFTGNDYDLYTTALLFRVLRQHGFRISCDIFNKFKDDNGKLKEELASDIQGMLSLFEATYLSVHDEDFLDEARGFTISSMESLMTQSSPHLMERIENSLKWPIHTGMNRLKARQYISFYEDQETRNEMLLKFAKMDFNVVQSMLRNELCQLIRWWRELNLRNDLSYARDRIVEGFFWMTGVYFEPKYSRGRIILTKAFKLTSLIDDTYDAFGIIDELRLFTEAIQRFDASGIDKLPDYMEILYRALLNYEDELEEELTQEGRSFGSYYEKQAVKEIVQAYHEEAEWFHKRHVPTFDEYIDIAMVTSGIPKLLVSSLLGMEDVAGIEEFQWIQSKPKCLKALQTVTRLADDVKTIEHEYERGHVATGLECYIKQHGVSKEEAVEEFEKRIRDAWKDLNEACMRPTVVSMLIHVRFLNFCRTMDYVYKYRDAYTYSDCMKNDIKSVLIDKIPVQDE